MLLPQTALRGYPYRNPPQEMRQLVEITDSGNRPLLLTPEAAALNSRLPRRHVLLCLRDTKKRVYLQQRAKILAHMPGLWDITVSGPVAAGESCEGAALRQLRQQLGIRTGVRQVASLPYIDDHGAQLSATFFLARPCPEKPVPNPALVADGMFVDADEVTGLIQHQPEMFTPELVWAVRSGWLFARSGLLDDNISR